MRTVPHRDRGWLPEGCQLPGGRLLPTASPTTQGLAAALTQEREGQLEKSLEYVSSGILHKAGQNSLLIVFFKGSISFCFQRFYLFIFREGKGGRKREKNINVWLPLERPLLGTWPTIQACALTGN